MFHGSRSLQRVYGYVGNYFDEKTASVQASLLLLNLESGMVARVSVESQTLDSGGVSFDESIAILDLYPYSMEDSADITRLVFEIIAATVYFVLIGMEFYELWHDGWREYLSLANCLDFLGYAVFGCMAVIWLQYVRLTSELVDQERRQYSVYDPMATHRILLVNNQMAQLQDYFETITKIEEKLNEYDVLATVALVTMVLQLLKNLDFHPKVCFYEVCFLNFQALEEPR